MLFDAVLYVTTGVGGCGWPISAWAVLMDVAFWQFSNNPPNYDSVVDAMVFLIMLHYTFTGTFTGAFIVSICWILVQKRIHLLFFMPLFLIRRIHPNIYG